MIQVQNSLTSKISANSNKKLKELLLILLINSLTLLKSKKM